MTTPEPRDPLDWTPQEWAELQADLDRLEATDPAVRAAAESYDRMVHRVIRGPRPGRTP
jgi:hypothetical protein